MQAPVTVLVFLLDSLRVGLPLSSVERVVPACELTPLPGGALPVLGAFNLNGTPTAVLDLRLRLRQPPRSIGKNDHFVMVQTGARIIAVVVDEAEGVVEFPSDAIVSADDVVVDEGVVGKGLVRLADGLLLIEDPTQFLDVREMQMLEHVLDGGVGHAD